MNLIPQAKTMSSREIAELTETRHDSVKRSIERLAKTGVVSFTPTVEPTPGGGKPTSVLSVNERDSYVIVAQLSPQFTGRLVDRWQELEKQQAPAIPQTYAEALQLAANQAKQLEEQAPKIDVYEKLADRKGDVSTTVIAKQLGTTAIKLNRFLRDIGAKWQNADLPKAGYTDWMNVVADIRNGHEFTQCLITPKGQIEIAKLWNKPKV